MTRAPTRLEILNNIERLLEQNDIEGARRYVQEAKKQVLEELERRRQRESSESKVRHVIEECMELLADPEIRRYVMDKYGHVIRVLR